MNAELGTSILLALAVAIWLSWLGSRVARTRKVAVAAPSIPAEPRARKAQEAIMAQQVDTRSSHGAASAGSAASASGSAKTSSAATTPQRTSTTQRTTAPLTPAKPGIAPRAASSKATAGKTTQPPLKLHYDRLAIAGVGLLALIAVPVTVVLRLVHHGSWALPVVALLVAVAAVVGLRTLANRGRKHKVEQAFRHAMSTPRADAPAQAKPAAPAEPTVKAETELFDVQEKAQKSAPLSAEQLRKAALAFAEGAKVSEDGSWEPVQVPMPTYVQAAKAERPAPEPLQVPAQPKPSGTASIKAQEAAAKAPAVPAQPAVAPASARAKAAQNNLDVVLQRRRA